MRSQYFSFKSWNITWRWDFSLAPSSTVFCWPSLCSPANTLVTRFRAFALTVRRESSSGRLPSGFNAPHLPSSWLLFCHLQPFFHNLMEQVVHIKTCFSKHHPCTTPYLPRRCCTGPAPCTSPFLARRTLLKRTSKLVAFFLYSVSTKAALRLTAFLGSCCGLGLRGYQKSFIENCTSIVEYTFFILRQFSAISILP